MKKGITYCGTCYFSSLYKANQYYKSFGLDKEDVARKVCDKEIFIGIPPIRENSKIKINLEGRYIYEIEN